MGEELKELNPLNMIYNSTPYSELTIENLLPRKVSFFLLIMDISNGRFPQSLRSGDFRQGVSNNNVNDNANDNDNDNYNNN